MKDLLLSLFFLCSVLCASAQYNTNQNMAWAFGWGAGLDFTSGTPIPFSSSIHTGEGCASVCNSAGSLLFYTNGDTVYNRLGLVMPGGAAIVPFEAGSSTQAAVIVPFINDTNKYYIFSQEDYPSGGGKLAYSIVDMTLDGGLGGIAMGSSGILVTTDMTEKMIAIPGNSCNIWLMVHRKDVAQFYAYEITSAGVSTTPVISHVGTFTGVSSYEFGVMKCSHDRRKLVVVSGFSGYRGVELFDFDITAGIVSNCRLIEPTLPVINSYGAEFSPDNTRLYTSDDVGINQWDISLPTTAAISGSKTKVDSVPYGYGFITDMRLAPDGKIYYQRLYTLSRINYPNLPGTSCGVATSVLSLAPGTIQAGLPNLVWRVQPVLDTATVCVGSVVAPTPLGSGGTWISSDPSVATVNASGLVTGVSVGTAIIYHTPTVGCALTMLVNVSPGANIEGKTSLCEGDSTLLTCGIPGGAWSSGSSHATVLPTGMVTGVSAGTSNITYTSPGGCTFVTIMTIDPLPAPIAGPTIVALGSTITLTDATAGGSWTSSDTTKANVNSAGMVTGISLGTVTIYYALPTGCKVTMVITVMKKGYLSVSSGTVPKPTLYPNPASNEITITAERPTFTTFIIYNALGQEIIKQEITSTEIKVNVKALPPGEYHAVFEGDGIREMTNFVKWQQ